MSSRCRRLVERCEKLPSVCHYKNVSPAYRDAGASVDIRTEFRAKTYVQHVLSVMSKGAVPGTTLKSHCDS